MTIECGTFLTIIGSSGSGKTTILKMINGLIKADKGEVLINDKNIQDEDLIELRRKNRLCNSREYFISTFNSFW